MDQVIAEALGDPGARPPIPRELADNFAARLRRELAGWAPEEPLALAEWVRERIAVPLDEGETLRGALPAELGEALREDPGLGGRLLTLSREGAGIPSVVHREWAELWREDPLSLLGPWLRYEGPLSPARIAEVFGRGEEETGAALEELAGAGELARELRAGEEEGLVSDRENLDLLLRLVRRKARPQIKERPLSLLAPYLALRQGLIHGGPLPGGGEPWAKLSGCPAPARLWESAILPAREAGYTGENLERAVREGRLLWYGAGKERIAFAAPEELELFSPGMEEASPGPLEDLIAAGWLDLPRDFWALREALGRDSPASVRLIWEAVWGGRLSADSWEPVRRGLEQNFSPPGPQGALINPPPGGPLGMRRRIPPAL
jgi:ATP-dependent Lhr-like helicase